MHIYKGIKVNCKQFWIGGDCLLLEVVIVRHNLFYDSYGSLNMDFVPKLIKTSNQILIYKPLTFPAQKQAKCGFGA